MTNRAIFNRRYSSFTADGTEVWLVNGAGVTTTPVSTLSFTAGEDLIQGEVVYVSGAVVLAASAASGIDPTNYNAIGITSAAATATNSVEVILDDNAVISSSNLTHETSMVAGQYYYLSSETGKLVSSAAPSGITLTGGYAAVAPLGLALSPTELHVEIESPIVLAE